MDTNEILSQVNEIFKTILKNNNVLLQFDSTAKDVEGWDSLSHMIIINAIEEHFKIKFALKEIIKMKNINDMCATIQQKTN